MKIPFYKFQQWLKNDHYLFWVWLRSSNDKTHCLCNRGRKKEWLINITLVIVTSSNKSQKKIPGVSFLKPSSSTCLQSSISIMALCFSSSTYFLFLSSSSKLTHLPVLVFYCIKYNHRHTGRHFKGTVFDTVTQLVDRRESGKGWPQERTRLLRLRDPTATARRVH